MQKALHQLPLIRSAERFLFSRLSLFKTKCSSAISPHQLPLIRSAERFLSSRLSLFNAKSSSSAAFDLYSGKVPFFKVLSLQCKMLFISCIRIVQRKGSFSKALSLQSKMFSYNKPHQLPLIRSAERFLISRLTLFNAKCSPATSLISRSGFVQRKGPSQGSRLMCSAERFASRLSSLQCNKLSSAAVNSFSGKAS